MFEKVGSQAAQAFKKSCNLEYEKFNLQLSDYKHPNNRAYNGNCFEIIHHSEGIVRSAHEANKNKSTN